MSNRLRCAIYTRKSSEEGLEQNFNSLHAQREACEAYILSQTGEGWSLIKTAYDDGGYSGGSMNRPALQQLMADIERGLVDVVVVYKVDRLTRALTDFAKIVERFDAKGVSFVSVTQAFNTTSSMGRLTLNVLLSFAQFEREVTGERIRDKVAASKAKGLRMGGRPPLGYDIAEGRLVVNTPEAEQVRDAFRRYLELGSTARLAAEGVRSKRWINRAGEPAGGTLMGHGSLGELLRNETYLGVTKHKDRRYPDTHPAIVDAVLFAAVQARLSAAPASTPSKPRIGEAALLAGKIYDDRSHAMDAVHTSKAGRFYRYYVSRPLIRGLRQDAGSLARISVAVLEPFLCERLEPLLAAGWRREEETTRRVAAAVRRLTVSADQLVLVTEPGALRPDAPSERADDATDGGVLRLEFHMRKRQGVLLIEPKDGVQASSPRVDRALVRAVVLARSWASQLERGEVASAKELARREGLCNHYLAGLLPLAYLAPKLTEAILEGRQPRGLTLGALTRLRLSADWNAQRVEIAAL